MADLPDDQVHVATGAANRVVQTYGFANFLPVGFLETLIRAILGAVLQHQAGQAIVQQEPEPKNKRSAKSEED